jgi:phosphatidyl-myo-inositol dimannoside synthase
MPTLGRTLFITEDYPPAVVGGAANMFAWRFSLYPPDRITVLTKNAEDAAEFDQAVDYEIQRTPIAPRGPRGFEWLGIVGGLIRAGIPLARRRKVSVVQCARPFPEGVAAYFIARALGTQLATNSHGEDISILQNYVIERTLMKLVLRGADINLVNSRFTESLVKGLAGERTRTMIFHPGFDPGCIRVPDPERVLRLRNQLGGIPILLTVGRLQLRKGQDNVIRALPIVTRDFPNVKYILVGRQSSAFNLEKLAEELGVRQNVIVEREIGTEELSTYYAACDLFVMPNRREPEGDVEGFGIVFLEAGFFQKPVIGGNSGGVPDAVQHGLTGLLVDGNSVQEIANAILQILHSPELGRDMGLRGREHALAQTHEVVFEQYRAFMMSRGL